MFPFLCAAPYISFPKIVSVFVYHPKFCAVPFTLYIYPGVFVAWYSHVILLLLAAVCLLYALHHCSALAPPTKVWIFPFKFPSALFTWLFIPANISPSAK